MTPRKISNSVAIGVSSAFVLAGCGALDCQRLAASELEAAKAVDLCGNVEDARHASASRQHSPARLVHIGTLDSDVGSVAFAVNERGLVVGGSNNVTYTYASRPWHAFAWDEKSGIRALDTLGGEASLAFDVNDDGEIVGFATTEDGRSHAVLWDEHGRARDLGTLGGDSSVAYAINNRGQVVGWSQTDASVPGFFLWDAERGMQEMNLGVDLRQGGWGNVNDINDDGVVVGSISSGGQPDWPFQWTEQAGRTDLDPLGYSHGEALAINTRGQVAGYMHDESAEYGTIGVTWPAERATKLAGFAGPTSHSWIRAINDHGVMVGSDILPDTESLGAVQWDTPKDMRVLPLDAKYSKAYDIDNQGRVVGTYGDSDETAEAFLWSPEGGS